MLTLAEIENLVATWIVSVWQNRKFGEYGPCWDPGGDHSPNTLFAAAMAQGGFSLEIPRPELYYELLPAHHVKIHTRGVKIRELMSLPVTLILVGVGIPRSGLLRDGRKDPRTGQWLFPPVKDRGKSRNDDAPGQTDLRFDLLDLDRFTYDTPAGIAARTAHLVGIEQQLRLLHGHDGMLSDGAMPEYLFRRTGGIVGLVKKLVQAGCRYAIETGLEQTTTELLDTLALSPADLPDLDPDAGEVPDIPAAPAAPPRKAPRPRNTVFDDQGTPAAETAS